MSRVDEIFGEIPDKPTYGDFDLLPEDTKVLAVIESADGKLNKHGRPYPALVLKVVGLPDGLEGNYGEPRIYDYLNFQLPPPKASVAGQPDEIVRKHATRVRIWANRCMAVGVSPATWTEVPETADVMAQTFVPAVGRTVGIKVGVEKGTDGYNDKNVAKDYYEATEKFCAKYNLKMPGAVDKNDIPF